MSPDVERDVHPNGGDPIWAQHAGDPSAPLVALVHGTMDRSAGMLRLSRQLDRRFHVLRYDRRGYGRSTPHGGTFTVDDHVDDLVALLADRRAVLVGHSFGGNVALAAAERRPDLVAAVATYEAPVSWLPWWPTRQRSGTDTTDTRPADIESADRAERFIVTLIGAHRWAELPERTRAARRSEGATLVAELASLASAPPWHGARIRVPVVVGVGGRAADHHRRAAQHLASEVPGAELVELPGCGHDAPTAAPQLMAHGLVGRAIASAGPPWSKR